MSLKAELEALRATKPRNFKDWLGVAEDEDRTLALAAIYDVTLPANALAGTLNAHGIPVTRETIVKMRHDAQ